MAICSTKDAENKKFDERCGDDKVVIRTVDSSLLGEIKWDDAERTATTTTTDTWTFRFNSVDLATVLLTYADATKDDIIRAQLTKL